MDQLNKMKNIEKLEDFKYNNHGKKRIYTNCDLIDQLHFLDGDLGDWRAGTKYAFFINSTVFAKCEKFLGTHFEQDKFDIWDYEMQMNNKFYDMKLVFLTIDEVRIYEFLQDMVFCTQYTFPWEDNANLFQSVNSYYKLEKFIRKYFLKSSIEKIEEIESISDDGANIKVITFASYVDKNDLIQKHREFMEFDGDTERYYYFTPAFPWYQQPLLEHFDIPIERDYIDLVFPIVFCHLYRSKMINIIELISINLAICDFRNLQQTIRLKTEIDSLIQLSLYEMIKTKSYIKKKTFDLIQYSLDHNARPSPSCILYFVYTFQNYFDSVQIEFKDELTLRPALLHMQVTNPIIKLTEQFEEVNRIGQRFNIYFRIDGTGFNTMTCPLFLNLFEHDNVSEIILDTNFTWIKDDDAVLSKTYHLNKIQMMEIKLFGNNSLHFIEEFIGFLKTFIYSNKLNLTIDCTLDSYFIFDNLELSTLEFYGIHVDHKLLDELSWCNLKLKTIRINNCTLENKIENWELMVNLKQLQMIVIEEDENTWQFMFDFISTRLINSDLKEFKFYNVVIISDDAFIGCHHIRFTMDEYNSKLLLQDLSTQMYMDLYHFKRRNESLSENEDEDYEFYQ